jgi:ABC-type sugar transport system ATPase subunit
MENRLALQMRNIRKTFPGVVALDDGQLELRARRSAYPAG